MSFWYGDPSGDRPSSVGGGMSTLAEIDAASKEKMQLVDNTNARYTALYRAYEDRLRTIKDRTGETRENPLTGDVGVLPGQVDPRARMSEFNDWLQQMQARHPEAADIIRAGTPVERDAEALARNADERLAKAMAAREGYDGLVASIWGGIRGSFYDPLQVLSMIAGGGPGAARTAVGRIATVAAKEAVVNGMTEAAAQPFVQSWREQAGLPYGWKVAMQNVGFASLAGGVLGGGLRAAGEVLPRLFRGRELDQAAAELAKSPSVRPEMTAALRGDPEQALDAIRPLRDTLPAEARGAIDHAEILRREADIRPLASSIDHHDRTIDRATRAALADQAFVSEPSPEQIARIVDQLAPAIGDTAPVEQSLQQFLMRSGGLKDFKGELDALGLSNVSERFVGKLVREDGMPLDDARRAAAEAGFFNDRFGTADEAMAKSTVNDLLDALDTSSRSELRVRGGDAERAYIENLVADIAGRAGPAVDDDLILRAVKLANAEDMDPAEALDRVLIEHDRQQWAADEASNSPPAVGRVVDNNDLSGGVSDPGHLEDDAMLSAADLDGLPDDYEIPFFDDGRSLTGAELMGEIEHMDNLFQLVEACRS